MTCRNHCSGETLLRRTSNIFGSIICNFPKEMMEHGLRAPLIPLITGSSDAGVFDVDVR